MNWPGYEQYSYDVFRKEAKKFLSGINKHTLLDSVRRAMYERAVGIYYDQLGGDTPLSSTQRIRIRDCTTAFRCMMLPRSAKVSGFDVAQVLWDVARGVPRTDLQPGFWAEMIYMVQGIEGRSPLTSIEEDDIFEELSGREAAVARSADLDALWRRVEKHTSRYACGLDEDARARRARRRDHILRELNANQKDWLNWKWQCRNVITTSNKLQRLVKIDKKQASLIDEARNGRLPFGVTPYYASLMDDDYKTGRDRAVRAQVLPPARYVHQMLTHRKNRYEAFDFMGESDTSPCDLITRRYPGIVILKPYNTCPQICVYCQRNWEIEEAMGKNALASEQDIEKAMQWIEERPTIKEVLVTGGDPLALGDNKLRKILTRLAQIPHVDMIRIGSRTLATIPMRITEGLTRLLGSLREHGKRDICIVTHFEHPYEITDDVAVAVNRLKRQGINIYNQQVFTFYVSRRFESVALRMKLRLIGIDPYYLFMPKGKEETGDYLVPLSRILQERKEEARLVPGIRRTDEPVYNVPRLGKNHIRERQGRDILTFLPDGSRVYEFHPWEKNIVERDPYVAIGIPILTYLSRLAKVGEDPDNYMSIWYYF